MLNVLNTLILLKVKMHSLPKIYIQLIKILIKIIHIQRFDSSLMLSALSVNIPFSNHSQYPRNVFSCQQTKQAVGVYSSQLIIQDLI